MLTQGWSLLWACRWRWLACTHLGLAAVLVLYFLMVLFNSAGFDYSFWNEPPPSGSAELAASLSLMVLAALVTVVGFAVYGAYCVMALDVLDSPGSGDGSPLARAIRPAGRALWWGPGAFLLAVAAVLLVGPAVLILPVLAPLPFAVIQDRRPFLAHQASAVRQGSGRLVGCSAITAIGGILIWLSAVLCFALADSYDGLVELLVIPIVWACFLTVALLAAFTAACTAVVVGETTQP